MKRQTLEMIAKAMCLTGDDPTRYNICHVAVNGCLGGMVRIRATNGHALSEVLVADQELSGILEGNQTVGIHRDQLAAVKLMLKENKYREDYNVIPNTTEPNHIPGFYMVGTETTQVKATRMTGDYPDTDALWPRYQTEPFQVSLNPELLLTLFKSLNTEKGQNGVVLVIKDKGSPIHVTHGDFKGLVMPMRFTAKEYCAETLEVVTA